MSIAVYVPMNSLCPVCMITAGGGAKFVGSRVDPKRVIVTKYMPETS